MITCNLCGSLFNSCEEFESHIDNNCILVQENDTLIEFTYQAFYSNGKSELRKINIQLEKLKWIRQLADESLQKKRTDKDFTEPNIAILK
jgi:hypothetical protein